MKVSKFNKNVFTLYLAFFILRLKDKILSLDLIWDLAQAEVSEARSISSLKACISKSLIYNDNMTRAL